MERGAPSRFGGYAPGRRGGAADDELRKPTQGITGLLLIERPAVKQSAERLLLKLACFSA